jgi:TPR repeat protein
MYNLAKMHDLGMGVKQDFPTSLHWLRKAAAVKPSPGFSNQMTTLTTTGVAEAQHSLGLKYNEGVGVKQDFRWLVSLFFPFFFLISC